MRRLRYIVLALAVVMCVNQAVLSAPPDGSGLTPVPSSPSTGTTTSPPNEPIVVPSVPGQTSGAGLVLRFTVGQKRMVVNSTEQQIDVPPLIVEGRTLVPVRYLAEPLGAEVSWDGHARSVTIVFGQIRLVLTVGAPEALVNGTKVKIDPANQSVTPLIIDDRVLMPLRFIAEALGLQVEWQASDRSITLTKQAPSPAPSTAPSTTPAPNEAPKPSYGLLHFTAYQRGTVDIWLDGHYLGTNPISNYRVSIGWHTLYVATKPGGKVLINQRKYMDAGRVWLYN